LWLFARSGFDGHAGKRLTVRSNRAGHSGLLRARRLKRQNQESGGKESPRRIAHEPVWLEWSKSTYFFTLSNQWQLSTAQSCSQ
jgi:hypothetical protein